MTLEMEASRTARIVLVTVPDEDTGQSMVRTVVGERLAACGNIVSGLRSIYWWEGAMQEDSEALILFKTSRKALPALLSRIQELHPYDVPEFLALPVAEGSVSYLSWVSKSLEGGR